MIKHLLQLRTRRRWIGLLVGAYLVYPIAMMASVALHGSVFAQISQAILMIVGILLVFLITQKSLTRQHLSLQTTNRKQIITWSVTGFVILQLFVLIREKRVPGTHISPVDQFKALGLGVSFFKDMLTILTIGLLVPLAEELIFRGAIFRVMRDRLYQVGKRKLILVTSITALIASIAFMQAHVDYLSMSGLIYVIMSLVFTIVYVQTGSLTTAIMVHVLNNAFALGQIVFSSSTGSLAQPWTAYLLLVLPILAWVVCQGANRVLPHDRVA